MLIEFGIDGFPIENTKSVSSAAAPALADLSSPHLDVVSPLPRRCDGFEDGELTVSYSQLGMLRTSATIPSR